MIEIVSRSQFKKLLESPSIKQLYVISINESKSSALMFDNQYDYSYPIWKNSTTFKKKVVDPLILNFDDVENDNDYPGAKKITKLDCEKILHHVNKYSKVITSPSKMFYVQCRGGVSRSAAVAAAICTIIPSLDDWWIFNDVQYSPNRVVYESILKCAGYDLTSLAVKHVIDEKFERNLELSKMLLQ